MGRSGAKYVVMAVTMALKWCVRLKPQFHQFVLKTCVESTRGKYTQLQPRWESVGSLLAPAIAEADQAQPEFRMN